ncbi:(d)CMP kinase [Candidatus Pelagibacter sp.]|nr:(d)CMP kinase [Candidatus Pelagibacter sp.]MDA9136583.1 (d)CMP kinase [Candidatus Pelagibacter sp.]
MKMYKKKYLQVAIDSPAAAGAGTQAKLISKHYKLLYLDSGKIYRLLAYLKIKNPKKFNYSFVSKKMNKLKISDLQNKKLLSDDVGVMASVIAKDIKIRKLANSFQMECAYNPPKKFKGSVIDGRDITYNIMPEADFKFFITASAKTRALRRFKELKGLKKNISLKDVLKSIKKRDKSDYNRKISPLKRTKDQSLISSENESKRSCFLKIKKIMDRKIKN